MSQQLAARAKRFGLRYVDVKELCVKRRRKGDRFVYVDGKGKPIRSKKMLARIAALAVPPAWEEVCLADDPQAHIQAVGRDAEGRLQYRYNDDWVLIRDKIKAERLLRFGRVLPRIRARVEKDLRRRGTGRRSAAAAASRLVDRALLRSGHSADSIDTGGRGATTLLKRDVRLNGTRVTLDFIGKGGKRIETEVKDPTLLARIRKLKSIGKKRLFAFRNGKGKVCYLTATDLNKYLRDAAGKRVTAKDFRTFAATSLALAELAEIEVPGLRAEGAESARRGDEGCLAAARQHAGGRTIELRPSARRRDLREGRARPRARARPLPAWARPGGDRADAVSGGAVRGKDGRLTTIR